MSFPATPIDLTVKIAPDADPSADPATWTWVDISTRVRITDSIVNARGKQSPLSDTVPASLSLLVDNTGGRFVPSNPIGPYYPLRRNCPIRLSIDPGTGYVTRLTGFVDAWPPRWDVSGNNVWVPVTAHGSMRRHATAGRSTAGALRRYITESLDFARLAYWPLEDGSDAKQAASADDQAGPMWTSGSVRFGTAAPLSGVTSLVDPSGGYLGASLPQWFANDWRLEFVAVWNAPWSTNQRPISWLTPGSVAAWNVVVSSAGLHLDGFKTDVALVTTQIVDIDTGFIPVPGQLHHIRIDTTMSGATMQVRMYVDGTQYGSTASLASSLTLPPTYVRINPDVISTDDVPLMGHLAIWAGNPVSDSAFVALGRLGETAATRMTDVAADAGVAFTTIASAASTTPMGAMPAGSLMAVLRDCEATDGGLLFEATDGSLKYVPRVDLYNQTVALTLDYDLGQVAPSFNPSVDDTQLRNDVTAKRPSGSEARYVDEAHVAAEGLYEDPISVNPRHDAALTNLAAWAVRKGTLTEQRFDNLSISLSHSPELIADWLACDIGSRIQVTNVPAELQPDTVDLILVGYTEVIEPPSLWTVNMVCEPAAAYTVGVRDADRRDTAGSEFATANLSAKADGNSATANVITVADAAAVGFAVGNRVVLHDTAGRRKEPGVFVITAMASGFGFTNINFSPAAETPPVGTFGGLGDFIRRVDQTSLLVATTLGPLWATGSTSFDVGAGGERLTVSNIDSTVRDTFTRTVAAGSWGTSDTGHAWSIPLGTASNFSANGSQGLISVSTLNAEQHATVDLGVSDIQEVRLWLTLPVTPTGAGINWGVLLRYVDATNYVWADVQAGTDSSLTLRLIKRVAGTATQLVTAASGVTHSTSVPRILQAKVDGSTLYSKVWSSDATEPGWQLDTTDASLPAGTQVGVVARLMTGNTNATPVQFRADNLAVVNPQTFTVTRAANGVEKAHSAGTQVHLWTPARRAL